MMADDQVVALRVLGLHLERLSHIALADQDIGLARDGPAQGAILTGRIGLRTVSFRYGPCDPLARFGYKNFHEQIGAVLQDDSLVAAALADNVPVFDDAPDRTLKVAATTAAAIREDIAQMPMACEPLVGDMGPTLSSGQKHRVLLTPSLYRRPKLLVMEEGVSHLDVAHERAVHALVSSSSSNACDDRPPVQKW